MMQRGSVRMESSPVYAIINTLWWECTRLQENALFAYYRQKKIKQNKEKWEKRACVWILDNVWLIHLND